VVGGRAGAEARGGGAEELSPAPVSVFLSSLLAAAAMAAPAPPPPESKPKTLAVMTFNVEYGGALVDFDKVVEAVRASGADVVGIEEAEGNVERLAERLGWPYYDTRSQVVSRLPLIDPSAADGLYVFVEVELGRVVALANVHLPSDPFGPDLLRAGTPREEILAIERRRRVPPLAPFLDPLKGLAASGMPVFLTGDFNSPSHRDTPILWPVSVAVEEAGLRDSYADVHPDVAADPGSTWWAARPKVGGWNPDPADPQVRIDFVYAGGPAKALTSRVVGETGRPGVDVAVTPWPSDHRAVVSTFSVKAVEPPTFVAVDHRRVMAGRDLNVRLHARGEGERVVLRSEPGGALTPPPARSLDAPTSKDRTIAFSTGAMAPGAYRAALVDRGGKTLAEAPFWIEKEGMRPEVETGQPVYASGEPILARWRHAPGDRWDWIGIYPEATEPARGTDALVWRHTRATIVGEAVLDSTAEGEGWPLPPGRYALHLLRDDGYVSLARAPFSVRAEPASPAAGGGRTDP
jgi:endonuclease/exonuclease/phosphatase family metal-dependent hydrolase